MPEYDENGPGRDTQTGVREVGHISSRRSETHVKTNPITRDMRSATEVAALARIAFPERGERWVVHQDQSLANTILCLCLLPAPR